MLWEQTRDGLSGKQKRMTSEGSEPENVATRPSSVIWYERLAWTALGLGLASTVANPAALAKYYHQIPTVYPIMFAASIAGQLLWIWLVARKRQNWARWISLFVILIGIPTTIWDSEQRFQINALAASFFHVAFAMSAVSVMLLFRADARAWFSQKSFVSGA
jgi:multidrug transporter EmrE-like cation transporter